jgi:hypothetical protein
VYEEEFGNEMIQAIITDWQIRLLIYDPETEEIVQWIRILAHYRPLRCQVVEMHAAMKLGDWQLESLAICDLTNDNYLLMDVGYDHVGRADDVIVHLRLRDDGKVLIEYDGIEYGIAHDLLEAGIAKEDILPRMSATPRPLSERRQLRSGYSMMGGCSPTAYKTRRRFTNPSRLSCKASTVALPMAVNPVIRK